MNCKTCNGELTKKQKAFCSTECKSKFQSNQPKEVFDETKEYMCKLDGKRFGLANKKSGYLKKYSKTVLNKEFDENDWEIVDAEISIDSYWNCPHCTSKFKVSDRDMGGWIAGHLLKSHNISKVRHVEQFPADEYLWPYRLELEQTKTKVESDTFHGVQCFECGEYFKKISNTHLKDKHGISMDEYKAKYPSAKVNSEELSNRTREVYFSEVGLSKVNPESKGEIELKEFVQSLGFITKKHKTAFSEIDVYIEDLKIGFEYHGLFHHSQFRGKHKKHRHSDNLKYAEELGIYLIQIFEDEWLNKKEIVKSRIKTILNSTPTKVYARKCEIMELTHAQCREFLNNNHLQGYKNAKYNIGLIYEGEVVQCMTFSDINNRANGIKTYSDNVFENVRSCAKINFAVVGGFERILTYFEETYKPNQIITFADRRWSSLLKEPFYIRLGFDFVGVTPNHGWIMEKYKNRQHRSNFTKPKMRSMNPTLFAPFTDDELTQEKMVEMLDLDIIWDCGHLKFVKNYKNNLEIPDIENIEDEIESDDFVRENRKRNPIATIPENSEEYVRCKLCNDYFKITGFHVHLGFEHKMKPGQYIGQFGEYRPSVLKKMNKK